MPMIKTRSRSAILALTQWRKDHALTQQEVADEMDISQQTLSALEAGNDCHVSTLFRYADAVDCDLTILLRPRREEHGILPSTETRW